MFLAFWIQCCFSGSCCGQDLQLQVLSCSACVFVVVTPIWQVEKSRCPTSCGTKYH
uniref:Uncharacterized protein n=1 Tax=Helianthus annuus TaxID=4232 RepID=A0A251RMR2_HELAN